MLSTMTRLALPLLGLSFAIACADPIDAVDAGPDAGPIDAAVDAEVGSDASAPVDAGPVPDGGVEADAGPAPDAGPACNPTGRRHFMLGSAQNPQTITFGEGLPTERTIEDFDGAYLAAFDSGGCFEWLARMPAVQSSFGGPNLVVDEVGNLYFALSLSADLELRDALDEVVYSFSSTTAAGPTEPYRRGVVVISYDEAGRFRWAKHLGNAVEAPAIKGYSPATLELVEETLHVAGSVNGTRGANDDYEVVFGAREPNETRVTMPGPSQFGFMAALDRTSGELVANSVRINAPQTAANFYAIRHNGRGIAAPAADGAFGIGFLHVGRTPGTYVLNRGASDERTVTVTSNFVAAFAKYGADRSIQWHRFAGAQSGSMSVFSSATLAGGALLFSGGAAEGADFEDVKGTLTLPVGAASYLVRYSASGGIDWLRGLSGRGLSRLIVNEDRGAIFGLGTGTEATTFGVGDRDAVTETLDGPFVARFDLDTGALRWISKLDASSAAFRDYDIIRDEIVVSVRMDGSGTFAPGKPEAQAISAGADIWSGSARYAIDDGTLRGVVEYVRHRGTRLNDGLNLGAAYEPSED